MKKLLTPLLLLVALASLEGCNYARHAIRGGEGNGFSNSGSHQRPAYLKKKTGNIEVWSNK